MLEIGTVLNGPTQQVVASNLFDICDFHWITSLVFGCILYLYTKTIWI